VVSLRQLIGGLDVRPLTGRRVLVTRTREQASELAAVLTELGAEAIEAPSITVTPPSSWKAVDRAASSLHEFDWVVFLSPNGVRHFCSRLRDARAFGSVRVAAVGSGTAAVLRNFGVVADLIPTTFTSQSVGKAFPKGSGRVLVVRADVADEALEEAVASRGWSVERVAAYRLKPARRLDPAVRKMLDAGEIDAITFASAGSVRAFASLYGKPLPKGVKIACIGPVTAKAARKAKLKVAAEAKEHTIPGLAAAVAGALTNRRGAR
jgi:uroporphyrinogen III methyltransferase/synthase